MSTAIVPWRSLKARVTLLALGVFVLFLWALVFCASQMLRDDLQKLLGEQQLSTVSEVAENINKALESRQKALRAIATEISSENLRDPAVLPAFLAQRPVVRQLFSGGLFVTRNDGIAIAEFPSVARRLGNDSSGRDYVFRLLNEEGLTSAKPAVGKDSRDAGIAFTTPLRDEQGKHVGVLVGISQLEHAVFADSIDGWRNGKGGRYLLFAPQYRLTDTTSEKKLFTETPPAMGFSPSLDRFLLGYEGSDVLVNPAGVEVLVSAKSVPIAGWSVAAMQPTEQAFTPIRNMQKRMLLIGAFLTLAASGLIWSVLRRELAPLRAAANALAAQTGSDRLPGPLPVSRQDEIGELVGGVNRLLATLEGRETAGRGDGPDSHSLTHPLPDLVWLKDKDGVFLSCNQRFERLFGALEKDIVGKTDYDFVDKEQADFFRANDLTAVEKNTSSVNEECVRFADDGHSEALETIKTPLFDSNHRLIGVLGIGRPRLNGGSGELRFSKSGASGQGGFRAFFAKDE